MSTANSVKSGPASTAPSTAVAPPPVVTGAALRALHAKGIALIDMYRKAEKRVKDEIRDDPSVPMKDDVRYLTAVAKVRTERFEALLGWSKTLPDDASGANYRGVVNPLTGLNVHMTPSRIIDSVAGADAAQIKSLRASNRKAG